jgi:hypothetical protein
MDIGAFLNDTKKTPPEGVWVTHDDGWKIKARPLYPWKSAELLKRAAKNGRLNETLYDQLLTDWVVEDWADLEADGKPVPCTPENKKLLFENWPEFNIFVKRVGLHLENQRREEEAKN